jgi:site-specific DNA-methyltransferase (adenine-specific)
MEEMPGELITDRIYHGDAFDLLPRVRTGTVDLIVTDPPFAIDFRAKRGNYNRKADRVLTGYREVGQEEYYDFSLRWMKEAYRALSDTGSMYVFSGWNQLKDILTSLDDCGFLTINHLIWKYQFGVFTRKKYVTSHYHILFVVKDSRRYTFNKIEHYPEDVWVIRREYWKGLQKTPTKLPVALVKRILLFSSNEGDLVLDPFAGSGTIPYVCRTLGRRFLGFEAVADYVDLANRRLAELDASIPGVSDTEPVISADEMTR